VFVVWSVLAYRPDAEARAASVAVERADGVWRFDPVAPKDGPGLVFFPGGLVDPRAYAPLARAVAREGYPVRIVELPRRGAFGGAESPELRVRVAAALASLDDARGVVLAGHSRGGVVASSAAAGRLPGVRRVRGLVLIGTSHPRDVDLSTLAIPVTKIVGTRDGLATPARVERNAHLLPPHTRWIRVDGGNHSQFGWYGFQPMDRRPGIDAATQRGIMMAGVIDVLESIARSSGGG